MNIIEKNMKILKRKQNEKLVFLFLYYNSELIRTRNNDPYLKNKYTIQDIAKNLDMDRSNVWTYVTQLNKKGLVEIINIDDKLKVIL